MQLRRKRRNEMAVKLIKNGSQNVFEKTDFRAGKDYRSPKHEMPAPNAKNTHCKSGPLKPTPAKVR
jgi:hypothetical protein